MHRFETVRGTLISVACFLGKAEEREAGGQQKVSQKPKLLGASLSGASSVPPKKMCTKLQLLNLHFSLGYRGPVE